MTIIKRKIVLIGLAAVIIIAVFSTPFVLNRLRWKMAVEAVGALPYQMGLASCVITQCVTTGTPPTCVGAGTPPDLIATPLCNTKGPGVCTTYAVVSGVKAGGMGANAIFLTTTIAAVGLNCPGGQMIAGGMSPVLMDSGVLASKSGCFGCVVAPINNSKYAFINKILKLAEDFKFIIAGKKEDKK